VDSSRIWKRDGSSKGHESWGLAESVGEYIGDEIVDTGEVMGCGFVAEADGGERALGRGEWPIGMVVALEPDG